MNIKDKAVKTVKTVSEIEKIKLDAEEIERIKSSGLSAESKKAAYEKAVETLKTEVKHAVSGALKKCGLEIEAIEKGGLIYSAAQKSWCSCKALYGIGEKKASKKQLAAMRAVQRSFQSLEWKEEIPEVDDELVSLFDAALEYAAAAGLETAEVSIALKTAKDERKEAEKAEKELEKAKA